MSFGDILVLIVLGAFLLYGVITLIALPIIAKKFYREKNFVDTGKSSLDALDTSDILKPLATNHLYKGEYRGYTIRNAKCHLQKRSLFTFSKLRRKQLQSRWSVTILECEQTIPVFSLLQKTDPQTVMMMLSDPGHDLSVDEEIEKRYLLLTEDPDWVIPLITGEIREFLMNSELASIESLGNALVLKRSWPIERIESSLTGELDCVVSIAEAALAKEPTSTKLADST